MHLGQEPDGNMVALYVQVAMPSEDPEEQAPIVSAARFEVSSDCVFPGSVEQRLVASAGTYSKGAGVPAGDDWVRDYEIEVTLTEWPDSEACAARYNADLEGAVVSLAVSVEPECPLSD